MRTRANRFSNPALRAIPILLAWSSASPAGALQATSDAPLAPVAGSIAWGSADVIEWNVTGSGGQAKVDLGGTEVELALSPVDVLAPDAKWYVNDRDRSVEMAFLCKRIRCYRGVVLGEEGSVAVAAVSPWETTGFVLLGGDGQDSLPVDPYFVSSASLAPAGAGAPGQASLQAARFPYVDLALEADTEFFLRFGNGRLSTTVSKMLTAANLLDFFFQREVGIRYRISFGSIWTQEPDPYYSLNTKDLVNGMRAFWNQQRAWVVRDSAHLLSGKTMNKLGATPQVDDGYPGHICNPSMAYSVSSAGDVPYGFGSAFLTLVSNVIHEQGHQWGSGHNCCRIMCGDSSCFVPILEFDPLTRGIIWNQLATRVCLDWIPVDAGPEAPDLVVSHVELPAQLGLGQSGTASVTVTNVGLGRAQQIVKVLSWLTLDGDPFRGFDDIPMGGPGLTNLWPGVRVVLEPGASQTFTYPTFHVPMNAAPGNQQFVVLVDAGALPCGSLCEGDEWNNLASRSVLVKGVGARVTSVVAPPTAISGRPLNVQVTVENESLQTLDIPVGLSLGGVFVTRLADDVPALGQRTLDFDLVSPPSQLDCGDPDRFSILACANLAFDTFRANDCRSTVIDLVDPYFDLKVEIVDAPSSARRGDRITWKARWTNVGNAPSMNVCMRTGIALWSGDPHSWSSGLVFNGCGPGPLQFVTLPVLQPGQSHEKTFSMCIHPGALATRQYLKVGVDRAAGCWDYCHRGSNFAERSITIRP